MDQTQITLKSGATAVFSAARMPRLSLVDESIRRVFGGSEKEAQDFLSMVVEKSSTELSSEQIDAYSAAMKELYTTNGIHNPDVFEVLKAFQNNRESAFTLDDVEKIRVFAAQATSDTVLILKAVCRLENNHQRQPLNNEQIIDYGRAFLKSMENWSSYVNHIPVNLIVNILLKNKDLQIGDVPSEIKALGSALAPLSKHITYMPAFRSIADKDQRLVGEIHNFQEKRISALNSGELKVLVKGAIKNSLEPAEWLKLMSRIDTIGEMPLNLSELAAYGNAVSQLLQKILTMHVCQLLDAIQEKMDRRLTIAEIQNYQTPFSKLCKASNEHPWQSFELVSAIQAKGSVPLSGDDIESLADALKEIRFSAKGNKSTFIAGLKTRQEKRNYPFSPDEITQMATIFQGSNSEQSALNAVSNFEQATGRQLKKEEFSALTNLCDLNRSAFAQNLAWLSSLWKLRNGLSVQEIEALGASLNKLSKLETVRGMRSNSYDFSHYLGLLSHPDRAPLQIEAFDLHIEAISELLKFDHLQHCLLGPKLCGYAAKEISDVNPASIRGLALALQPLKREDQLGQAVTLIERLLADSRVRGLEEVAELLKAAVEHSIEHKVPLNKVRMVIKDHKVA